MLCVGTLGYTALGLNPFDALYQTAITVTTVGYGEIGIEDVTPASFRAFTLFVVLIGATTAIYTVSVLLEAVVEGAVNDRFRRRRMTKHIEHLDGHIIVAGWGRVGRAIARYASRHGAEVVVVDMESVDAGPHDVVTGDALEDETLIAAGISRAAVFIAALDTDGANLALTLTARSLRPDIFLVARTAKQSNEKKFRQAGADRIVNPHEIGGSRMGALAMHPTIAEFLDEVLHDEDHDVEIAEVPVDGESPLAGLQAGDVTQEGRALLIAVRHASGDYVANPPPTLTLTPGDVLIALGSGSEVLALRAAVHSRRTLLHRGRTGPGT